MRTLILYFSYDAPEYIVFEKEKLIFISIPKSACSSIKKSLYGLIDGQRDAKNIDDDYSVHALEFPIQHRLKRKHLSGEYLIFSIYRDPKDRFLSSYKSKVLTDPYKKNINSQIDYEKYLFGYLLRSKDFEDYTKRVSRIPDFLKDRHIKSTYKSCGSRKIVNKTIFLDFQNLEREFEPIKKKYNLSDLEKFNQSNKKNISIPTEVSKKILKIYSKDYEIVKKICLRKRGIQK